MIAILLLRDDSMENEGRLELVTTNSISQVFQRRVIERHMTHKAPISLLMAIPDHPWTKAGIETATVRIAMTVAAGGVQNGALQRVVIEKSLETDSPVIEFTETTGNIHSDLTIGAAVSTAVALASNSGLASRGMQLFGAGFMITQQEAAHLGLGKRPGLDRHIRQYRNGRDLTFRPRDLMVIDLFGLEISQVRDSYPEIYQHVLLKIKPERDKNHRPSYKNNWWIFGEPRSDIRPALERIGRFIATPVTQKHRIFQFLSTDIIPDDAIIAIADDDAFSLGILHSYYFAIWFAQNSSTLEDRPRFIKSRCFDPFPFPAANDLQKQRIRAIAENLDAHRKRVLAEQPHLTLTGLYNILEKLRAGTQPDALGPEDRRIFDDGLVLILKEYHDKLDTEVAAAYGWPADLPDTEILTRLVALNAERAKEEAAGQIRWLRPEYQIPRFGTPTEKLDLIGGTVHEPRATLPAGKKPLFPTDNVAQTAAVMEALQSRTSPANPESLAAAFRQGRRILPQIQAVLASLLRFGFVATQDGGRTYALRRAA